MFDLEDLSALERRYNYLKTIGPTKFKSIYADVLCGMEFDESVDKLMKEDQQKCSTTKTTTSFLQEAK